MGEGDSQVAVGEEEYLQIKDSELKYILINAVKDLSKENDELKDRLVRIETLLSLEDDEDRMDQSQASLVVNNQDVLFAQNRRKPSKEQTTINYYIPKGCRSAQMNILDMKGKVVKQIPLNETGAGKVDVNFNKVASGKYKYQLVADGEIVEIKAVTVVQ